MVNNICRYSSNTFLWCCDFLGLVKTVCKGFTKNLWHGLFWTSLENSEMESKNSVVLPCFNIVDLSSF